MAEQVELFLGIAGLEIRMLCKYPYTERLCGEFLVDGGNPDMTVEVSDAEIEAERNIEYEHRFSHGYCEGICLYRAIAEKLPEFDGFVFHGAAVTVDGRGVIFAAPSGTGKTTHISLLLQNYPDNVKILNGDKPIIRKIGGEWRLCSTPWAGKEGWKVNETAPLSAIVLLERAEDNSIVKTPPEENFDEIMRQVYLPKDAEARFLTLSLVDEMAGCVDFYRLGCNMEKDAAKCSFETLK